MQDFLLLYIIGSIIATIIFFLIGKWILNINTSNVQAQLSVQNQLLALIAEKLGVPENDVKSVLYKGGRI